MKDDKHSVVIVGGGVGGLRAASLLSKNSHYDVSLISKKKSFDHHTSIFRNKKGKSKRHITLPLHKVFSGRRQDIDLVRAEITKLDPVRKQVRSSSGIEYKYDSLIVALEGESRVPEGMGGEPTFNAYSAGSMNALRRMLIHEFETAQPEGNYVVIGAGENGVEIVYELKQQLDRLAKQYNRDPGGYKVILVEQDKRIMPKADPRISNKLMGRLDKKGIVVKTGITATKLSKNQLTFSNDKSISTKHVILAAGQRANHFFADNKDIFLLDEDNFVRVNPLQEAEGYNNIYIVGNSKAIDHELNTSAKLYDAEYVVELMECKREGREIHNYEPPEFKARLELGKLWGVYESYSRPYFGRLGWFRKRWLDRSHFSTLLPTRLWFSVWLRGTQHDEIY